MFVSLATALGTLLLPYATMFVAQVPSAALMFLAFVAAKRDDTRSHLLAGIAGGMAALTNYLCVPAAVIIAIFGSARSRRRLGTFLEIAAGGVPFAIVLAVYQKTCCGGFFARHHLDDGSALRHRKGHGDLSDADVRRALQQLSLAGCCFAGCSSSHRFS